jgi:hypothetical protein
MIVNAPITNNIINIKSYFEIKSGIEDVLYTIGISNLNPNRTVELHINNHLLATSETNIHGICEFKSEVTQYYRPVRYDSFSLKFSDPQTDVCSLYLDKRPMPEEHRRLLITVHKALVYRVASNIATNTPLYQYTCCSSNLDIHLTEEHLKTAYNILKLNEIYGEYDSFISKQLRY